MKEMEPWEVYFEATHSWQHRKDDKIEVTKEQVEKIIFLAKPKPEKKIGKMDKWTEHSPRLWRRKEF